MKKICLKCGKERDSRGFETHNKFCRGDLLKLETTAKISTEIPSIPKRIKTTAESQVFKELPGLVIHAGLQEELSKERNREKETKTQHSEKNGFDEKIVECPSCHCVGIETKSYYMEPCQSYRCGMCGFAYQRNMIDGRYLYA